uniref:Uncharacterized protein n=1 Tax=Oryza glumipatula TaxID=40148 RepID=A0A0D9ZBL6_9ORYZ
MRWILNFVAGGLDDDDDFLFDTAEETEWSHYEAKRRTFILPPPPWILDFVVDGLDNDGNFLFHAHETERSHVRMTRKTTMTSSSSRGGAFAAVTPG